MNPGLHEQLATQMLENERVVITKLVMTFPKLSPANEQAVGTREKGFHDENGIHSTGTHNSNHPDVRWVLKTGDTGGISRRITTPVAKKAQDFRIKCVF
jgi:hypothetical protein